jgi:DNA-binding NarL/FixJ family response regulator
MCRALKVLCAAPSPERLAELKRAAVSVAWELVGGVTSGSDMRAQVEEWKPDVAVIDSSLGSEAVAAAREARPTVRVVVVGTFVPGADARAELDGVREAVAGLPAPGGPVRR